MGAASLTTLLLSHASLAVVVGLDCPTLDSKDRAALEVRARAELEALQVDRQAQVVCAAESVRVSLRAPDGTEQTVVLRMPSGVPRVDDVLAALAGLLQPAREATDAGVDPGSASASSFGAVPNTPPSRVATNEAVGEAPGGLAVNTPTHVWQSAPSVAENVESAPRVRYESVGGAAAEAYDNASLEGRTPVPRLTGWGVAVGSQAEAWSHDAIAVGPTLGVFAPFARLQLGLQATPGTRRGFSVRVVESALAYEYTPASLSSLTAVAAVSMNALWVNAELDASPRRKTTYFPGAWLALRVSAPLSRVFSLRAGPLVQYFGRSIVVELDKREMLGVGPWVFGGGVELNALL